MLDGMYVCTYCTLCCKSVAALIMHILGSCVSSLSNSATMFDQCQQRARKDGQLEKQGAGNGTGTGTGGGSRTGAIPNN